MAKDGAQPAGLRIRGKTEPPLTFWLVDSDEAGQGGVINKGVAEALIPAGCWPARSPASSAREGKAKP